MELKLARFKMANNDTESGKKDIVSEDDYSMPEVNTLDFNDIKTCLVKGISDFRQAPMFGFCFGGIFALSGILIVQSFYVWEKGWLIYPMIVGFPLIGPFAAVGIYDVSRRLDKGLPLRWNEILSVINLQTSRQLPYMAFVILFIFWIWMYQIRLLLAIFLGRMSIPSWDVFFNIITTTSEGWLFIGLGHLLGACFALLLFSVTVVSIPIILDRDVDFITAMITSVKTVMKNPFVMICWGIFIAITLFVSLIPLFLGLLISLPVLGHASWHIYKKAVI
jgi:uncharacterized membrane protein